MGPEAPAQQCYPEIAQAILPALTATFGSLGDPIKAWKDWKERRGKPVHLSQLSPWLAAAPRQAALRTDAAPGHVVNPSEGVLTTREPVQGA